MKPVFKSSLLALSVLSILSSCTQSHQPSKMIPLLQDSEHIISTRPQNQTTIMAIVKLKVPALLENAQHVSGVTQVDQDLNEKIQDEQLQAIEKFKKISSEVQVIYKYKYVLNAVCILAPVAVLEQLKSIGTIASWEKVGTFARPEPLEVSQPASNLLTSISEKNSSKFIGADKLNLAGITGKGVKVGVIDTGIDYTHAMFKGVGTSEAYKAIDPAKESTGFPSEKIVGGVDLVGTHYDSASPDFATRIPHPDLNPLDEGGHGTHVAGTIAGLGDSVHSYNGMAPDASLYAIKVFGADGSTSDMVVIAGLEYAVDPNGDGDLRDQLDVVNLSLGSGYGNPKILYAEAIKNLSSGGTVAVISAGNSGNKDYIVGAPGTSTESLSVAASIDDGVHNWQFSGSEIQLPTENLVVEAIEAATTQPIADGDVTGSIFYIGLGNKELTDDQKTQLAGKVALIDRGVVTFNEKVKLAAENGAIGVIVANNREGDAFGMGTTDHFKIPAIMITQESGQKIKTVLASNAQAIIHFKSDKKISKPQLIDTLTDFSSKGPRSIDGFLKPEISAPGSNVISAAMGGGANVVKMSGTSMAAPHMSGVMALLKQAYKNRQIEMSASDLKNVAMGTAKTIGEKGQRYPVTRQGSGRVQADVAAAADIVASEPSVSFGEINLETRKSVRSTIHLRNLSKDDKTVKIEFVGNDFIQLNNPQSLTLKSTNPSAVSLMFTLDSTKMADSTIREMDGWILIKSNEQEIYRIPVLAIAHKLSDISVSSLSILSSKNDSEGAAAELTVKNNSTNPGELLLFNFVGSDDRKPLAKNFMNADCDMQAVGYRIVEKTNQDGNKENFVQFAVKTFKPMTTWNSCDVSILVDSNQDGVIEQELLGANSASIPGDEKESFQSTLIDTIKAKEIRKNYELALDKVKNQPEEIKKLKGKEKYTDAIIDSSDLITFNNSTVVVVESKVANLKVDAENKLNFKVVVTHNEQGSVQMDDYLDANGKSFSISLDSLDQAFSDLSVDSIVVKTNEQLTLDLTKGRGKQSLMILLPENKFTFSDSLTDSQTIVVEPVYTAP